MAGNHPQKQPPPITTHHHDVTPTRGLTTLWGMSFTIVCFCVYVYVLRAVRSYFPSGCTGRGLAWPRRSVDTLSRKTMPDAPADAPEAKTKRSQRRTRIPDLSRTLRDIPCHGPLRSTYGPVTRTARAAETMAVPGPGSHRSRRQPSATLVWHQRARKDTRTGKYNIAPSRETQQSPPLPPAMALRLPATLGVDSGDGSTAAGQTLNGLRGLTGASSSGSRAGPTPWTPLQARRGGRRSGTNERRSTSWPRRTAACPSAAA